MSRGSINIQQVPKSKEFLSCLIPRQDCVWIDFDYAALEPTLLAELSQDASMLQLYGPTAKPNDIYIFVASQIPQLAKPFLDRGYIPTNPSPEVIALCKKECKKQRGIAKVLVLSSQYGAGPRKIHETLSLDGVEISFSEVKQIHAGYWELFKGIKEYEKYLMDMWRETGGYIINPIGRPLAVAEPFLKDIVNRAVQSGGHDILMLSLSLLSQRLIEKSVPYQPIIWDFHDECLFEVYEHDADRAVAVCREMFDLLNEKLDMSVKLKGEIKICRNLADAKIED